LVYRGRYLATAVSEYIGLFSVSSSGMNLFTFASLESNSVSSVVHVRAPSTRVLVSCSLIRYLAMFSEVSLYQTRSTVPSPSAALATVHRAYPTIYRKETGPSLDPRPQNGHRRGAPARISGTNSTPLIQAGKRTPRPTTPKLTCSRSMLVEVPYENPEA
jgi:hypothetical protein